MAGRHREPMTDADPNLGIPSALRPTLPAWAKLTPARLQHVQRVAELVASWAEQLGVPATEMHRWLKAGWLHDALRAPPGQGLTYRAPWVDGPLELRHGHAGGARAKAEGESDRGGLEAVRYHSIGFALGLG